MMILMMMLYAIVGNTILGNTVLGNRVIRMGVQYEHKNCNTATLILPVVLRLVSSDADVILMKICSISWTLEQSILD